MSASDQSDQKWDRGVSLNARNLDLLRATCHGRSAGSDLEAYRCQISKRAGAVSLHIAAMVPDSGKCYTSKKAGTAPHMHHFRK